MRWACILLPQLALDGVLRRRAEPDAPLVLVAGSRQRRELHAVNSAARALGLRRGMALTAAQALAQGFATVEHDPEDEARWRQFLAAWAYRFSSQVSTQYPHALIVEIEGSLGLFGPWPRFEARLREELTLLGFRHRIVAAPNPAAARVLAINAVQVWPYVEGALYQVYASPGRVTLIALQPGEQLVTVAAGDTVRWIVGDTVSGSGEAQRVSVLVKPTRPDLRTNLVITTDRRTYLLELNATEQTWMASVSWSYPREQMRALMSKPVAAPSAQPGLALEDLRFRYAIRGDDASWKPRQAFDDGRKVYIQFPAGIAQGELPPLFVVGPQGETQLVNYRFRAPYYIVDRLFAVAELRLGGDAGQVVRIERTDGVARRR